LNNVKIQIIALIPLYFLHFQDRYFGILCIFPQNLYLIIPLCDMNIFSQWGESYMKLRRLHSMQFYNLYTSHHIKPTETITSRKEWEGNATRMVDTRKINKTFGPKTRKLETIGRHKLWREYNIKMVLKEICCKSENWIHLAHVDTEGNFRIT